MTQFENNNFGDVLLNRHSVRHFDKTVKIPREELREMIKETITAPSACNLQAWLPCHYSKGLSYWSG